MDPVRKDDWNSREKTGERSKHSPRAKGGENGVKVHSAEFCGNVSWLTGRWVMSVFGGFSDQVDDTPYSPEGTQKQPPPLPTQLHGGDWFNMTWFTGTWMTLMQIITVSKHPCVIFSIVLHLAWTHWVCVPCVSWWVWFAHPVVPHDKVRRSTSPSTIDCVCFLGGSRRQVNGTPQKGFIRPEQLLEGKVSWKECVCAPRWIFLCVCESAAS